MTDSYIAVKDAERHNAADLQHTTHPHAHHPSTLAPAARDPVPDALPSPGSSGDPTAWEFSHRVSASPPPTSAAAAAEDAVAAVGAAVRERVERLADAHRAWQRENDVPGQRTPAVLDAHRDVQRTEVEREQDRSYEATLV